MDDERREVEGVLAGSWPSVEGLNREEEVAERKARDLGRGPCWNGDAAGVARNTGAADRASLDGSTCWWIVGGQLVAECQGNVVSKCLIMYS